MVFARPRWKCVIPDLPGSTRFRESMMMPIAITKPVDFDRLKEQLRQLPAAADYKR